MNFFQHQDDARRKTSQLILLFGLAVVTLIFITTIVVAGLLYYLQGGSSSLAAHQMINTSFVNHLKQLLMSSAFAWIAVGVIGVIFAGSLFKSFELKRGGDYVAESLGGRLVSRDQADAEENKLLNIVEEMAIASGTPVPRVYVLEEQSINAFAAGRKTSNAVIGVTRGCIQTLNREQLQGVIAHEFSHIHHGDMQLNMRLIAVLHGILLIGLAGQLMLRGGSSYSFLRSGRSKKGNSGAVLGLALVAIGFGGVFFGNLIKAAVSRQREYLADASAVQFTRNPQGIAAALLQIKRSFSGSHLGAPKASEFSHFYFANGIKSFFSSMFATHPPIDDRISRIYPKGVSQLETIIAQPAYKNEELDRDSVSKDFSSESSANENKRSTASSFNSLENVIDHIGEISPNALTQSNVLLAMIPSTLQQASSSPYMSRAIVYALLLDPKAEIKLSLIHI